jgi:hypothetical protein
VSPAPGRVTHRATPFPRLVAPDVVHLWTEPSQPRVSTMATSCAGPVARSDTKSWLGPPSVQPASTSTGTCRVPTGSRSGAAVCSRAIRKSYTVRIPSRPSASMSDSASASRPDDR